MVDSFASDLEAAPAGRDLTRLALVATLCGVLSGIFGAALSLSLLRAAAARRQVQAFAHQWPQFGWLIPVAVSAELVTIADCLVLRFAPLAALLVPGLPFSPTMGAVVGMAACFTAVVRAPFTGVLLVLGMTGTMTPLLPILAANVAATIVPCTLGNAPIYDTLRARIPKHPGGAGAAP